VRAGSTPRRTRVGKHCDLFAGLIHDGLDGSPYYGATKAADSGGKRIGKTKKQSGVVPKRRVLVNGHAMNGTTADGTKLSSRSFPLATFERAILSALQEIDPSEILNENSPAAEIAALERQLAWLAGRQAELGAELRHGDIPVIAEQLRELKTEENETAAKLDEARQRAAKPLSETWRDLGPLVDCAADPDARRRLRSAIARVVDSIWMVVVPRGRDRLCSLRVYFRGTELEDRPEDEPRWDLEPRMEPHLQFRSYFIIHRPPLWSLVRDFDQAPRQLAFRQERPPRPRSGQDHAGASGEIPPGPDRAAAGRGSATALMVTRGG
jgi:hypothetical protein